MTWIGEGPHLGLLEELLSLGIDPCDAGVQLCTSWPRPCNPSWQCPGTIEDPFYVEAINLLTVADLGMYLALDSICALS